MSKATLILGASPNPERFSYLAIKSLVNHGYLVYAVGSICTTVHGVEITTTPPTPPPAIHTVSMYLNSTNQVGYLDYIVNLNPQRIIFNPGSENPSLLKLARAKGIEVEFGCTLVMLNAGTY